MTVVQLGAVGVQRAVRASRMGLMRAVVVGDWIRRRLTIVRSILLLLLHDSRDLSTRLEQYHSIKQPREQLFNLLFDF